MRAGQVLQKCQPSIAEVLEPMHARREAVLLRSVEALMAGQRLTLTDVARAWPGAERVKARSTPLIGCSARQLVTLYGRRMQIESSFRDLKSRHFGHAWPGG